MAVMRFAAPFITLLLIAAPVRAAAATITPTLALGEDTFAALSHYKESAEGSIKGSGPLLHIAYHSSHPLDAYIAPLIGASSYNPGEMYHFLVPAAQQGDVSVDLSVMGSWAPGTHAYYLSFLSGTAKTDAGFTDMHIDGGSVVATVRGVAFQFAESEPYWVSNAHLLRGYRILGLPFAIIWGVLMLACVAMLLWRKRPHAALTVMFCAVLLYNLRFGIDLLRYSTLHTSAWFVSHTYAEPDDLYQLADAMKMRGSEQSHPMHVTVCFDSTDYYAKLLRYLLYPIPVRIDQKINAQTTDVVVTRKLQWSFANGVLHCGDLSVPAQKLIEHPSGSLDFRLTHP